MRRILAVIVAVFFCVALSGCSRGPKSGQYEAYLSIDSAGSEIYGAIFCIADIESDEYGYYIHTLYLPFDKKCNDVMDGYEPWDDNSFSVHFPCHFGIDGDIVIDAEHPADKKSFEKLKNARIAAYGPVWAPIDGDTYHWVYVHDGSDDYRDKIWFNTPEEAIAFGYERCKECVSQYE